MEAKARGAWGKRQELTDAEIEVECKKFFGALVVPPKWRRKGIDRCVDNGEITSVGIVYLDTRTKGFNVKHYRVWLNIYSLNGGIVEKTTDLRHSPPDRKTCVLMNKTIEAVNEYIYNEYHRIEREHKYWKFRQPIYRKRWTGYRR
jgi:hypothetical protein